MLETQQSGTKTSLDRILEFRNAPPEAASIAILRNLALAIDTAWTNGTLSGDLAPQHVSVSGDLSSGDLTVTLDNTAGRFIPEEELATDGAIPEAARYLPPERILGTATDVRSYEFSLGVIAYELLCGKKPFDAPNLTELFYRVCTEPRTPPREIDKTISPGVSVALSRALHKNRDQRFPDCAAFVNALSSASQSPDHWSGTGVNNAQLPESQTFAPVGESPSTTRIRRRYADTEAELAPHSTGHKRRYALIAASLLALAGLALFLVRYRPQPNLPVQVLDPRTGPLTPAPETAHLEPPKLERPKVTVPRKRDVPPVAQDEAALPALPETPGVEFLTDPPSAEVVIDRNSANACTSPCSLPLTRGRHTLTANLSGFNRAQRIFTVPQDKSLFMYLSRQLGTLVVTSTPSGVEIFIDGQSSGQTPKTLHLPPGEHRLLLVNGTLRHGETIIVAPDAIQAKSISW